jgi:hypothetical protein
LRVVRVVPTLPPVPAEPLALRLSRDSVRLLPGGPTAWSSPSPAPRAYTGPVTVALTALPPGVTAPATTLGTGVTTAVFAPARRLVAHRGTTTAALVASRRGRVDDGARHRGRTAHRAGAAGPAAAPPPPPPPPPSGIVEPALPRELPAVGDMAATGTIYRPADAAAFRSALTAAQPATRSSSAPA